MPDRKSSAEQTQTLYISARVATTRLHMWSGGKQLWQVHSISYFDANNAIGQNDALKARACSLRRGVVTYNGSIRGRSQDALTSKASASVATCMARGTPFPHTPRDLVSDASREAMRLYRTIRTRHIASVDAAV